jgi:hypothetical protein
MASTLIGEMIFRKFAAVLSDTNLLLLEHSKLTSFLKLTIHQNRPGKITQ